MLEVAGKSGTPANVLIKQQPFAEPGVYACGSLFCVQLSLYFDLSNFDSQGTQ